MIKVRAFRLRKFCFQIIFYMLFTIFIYLLLITLMKLLIFHTSTFQLSFLEETLHDKNFISNDSLQTYLLAKELGIETKDIFKLKNNETPEQKIEKNENTPAIKEKKEKSQYLSDEIIPTQKRPLQYSVNGLPSGKIQVGKAVINNVSKINLNFEELSRVSDFAVNEKTNVLIYHTHTSEAYEEVGTENNFRSTNDDYNVVAVGETLKENLLLKQIDVLHVLTKHDTPSYSGAYSASLDTVENILQKVNYQLIIDIHRDALSGNLHYRPTVQINEETASQLMFVVGTNASGLEHPHWMNNLKLAILIQNTAEEMYPGLFRDINLAKYRYNQHLSDGALILEVGATGNTLEETKVAMKYFANVISSLRDSSKK